jgi:hypothetical protein
MCSGITHNAGGRPLSRSVVPTQATRAATTRRTARSVLLLHTCRLEKNPRESTHFVESRDSP